MTALQWTAEIVVDASFAAEIVHKSVPSPWFLRNILEELLDVPQIGTIIRRRVLDESPPALGIGKIGISEALEVFVLSLYSYDRAVEEAVDGFLCDRNR